MLKYPSVFVKFHSSLKINIEVGNKMFPLTYLSVISLVIVASEGSVSMHNPFYCYSEDPIRPQISMFGIQCPYEVIRGQNINQNVSICTPSKFWMLSRHGTRNPAPNAINNILDNSERIHRDILANYEQGRTTLCASDIELLRNWSLNPSFSLEVAQNLSSSGWEEMEELAKRYQAAFPTILSSPYSPSEYFFRSAGAHRTETSLHAFTDGLFGLNAHQQVRFENFSEPDLLLRSYANCPLFQDVIAIREEQNVFREGPEYQEMTSQVSAKLGFHGSHALRNNEVEMIFLLCKYEQIFNLNSTSPFCGALSIANHQIHEYYTDLDTYYRLGYGRSNYRKLYENINCFVIQDLLRYLQSNDVTDHKARIFSTNNPTFTLFLVVLGVVEDDVALTRHNLAQQTNRLWKTGVNVPMAANFAVIRHE